MSMSAAGMAAVIEAQLTAPISNPSQLALALATAIVSYLKSNALVLPTSMSNSGGPVVGTGTVT